MGNGDFFPLVFIMCLERPLALVLGNIRQESLHTVLQNAELKEEKKTTEK